jgi:hypothetical protein
MTNLVDNVPAVAPAGRRSGHGASLAGAAHAWLTFAMALTRWSGSPARQPNVDILRTRLAACWRCFGAEPETSRMTLTCIGRMTLCPGSWCSSVSLPLSQRRGLCVASEAGLSRFT